MRRFLLIFAVLALVGAAFGAAATLSIDNDPVLQEGSDDDLTCDDGVTVHWILELDDNDTGTEVKGVRVADIAGACDGLELFVIATDGGGGELTDGGPVDIDSDEEVVNFDTAQDAEDVEDIHVFISS